MFHVEHLHRAVYSPDTRGGGRMSKTSGKKQRHPKFIRIRWLLIAGMALFASLTVRAAEPCTKIRGRAHLYSGDGQLRIWYIGTHHEFEPDNSSQPSVLKWLNAGVKNPEKSRWASPDSTVFLFADFVVCPIEPYKKGSVQRAIIRSAEHRHYVPIK